MEFFALEPEVAGDLGPKSVLDTTVHPPRVQKLNYEFDEVWLGDELLEAFPCFVVTKRLGDALKEAGLTGCSLSEVEVTATGRFRDHYPGRQIPVLEWLRPIGVAGVDDIGAKEGYPLVVSSRVLDLLNDYEISHCEIEEFES